MGDEPGWGRVLKDLFRAVGVPAGVDPPDP